jgi:hypothetical protein
MRGRRDTRLSGALGRLSYAKVAATLALFVALGGTAWALGINSVKSKHIAPNAVRSSDIKDGAVKTGDLAPSARSPLRVQHDEVITSETTTSTTLTDLATPGPSLEVTVPDDALVTVSSDIYYAAPDWSVGLVCTARVVMTPDAGTNLGTIGEINASGASANWFGDSRRHTRVPAGTYTFTMQYKKSDDYGTCAFSERNLWVEVTTPTG